ncbi:MAG: LTA synthase family protein [Clostridiales bacterium]|nr:LTA synthase family protein [Clostridiales bacterium]
MKKQKTGKKHVGRVVELVISCILFAVAAIFFGVTAWVNATFDVTLQQILYTMASPLDGSELGVVVDGVVACIPSLIVLALFILAGTVCLLLQRRVVITANVSVFRWRRGVDLLSLARHLMTLFALLSLLNTCKFVNDSLDVLGYAKLRSDASTLYERHYVDPNSVRITAPRRKKNLLCIYLESMETTYASREAGGMQPVNYIPNLTALAQENCSFSNSTLLGGSHSGTGTNWTMAALLSSTSGIPFSFPIADNDMGEQEYFASGCVSLGEILEKNGYRNLFLCGSDGEFAGRKKYFEQHGNYEVCDYFSTRDEGYFPEDYRAWWGIEDEILYEIAKDKLLKLAEDDQPFNFTMLTVDTHHIGGYVCELCGSEYENQTANVVACADRQIAEFLEWCSQQDFYEDTVIVVLGDHPRMDTNLVEGLEYYNRTVYNCFLNLACPLPDVSRRQNREFSTLDYYPTILAAMGFDIEGDRLGLGVNLFSDQDTLSERMGFKSLDYEIAKYSPYYVEHFA